MTNKYLYGHMMSINGNGANSISNNTTSGKAAGVLKDMPGWAKAVIIIIIILFVIWLVYKFYKNVAPPSTQDSNIENDINNQVNAGQKPTFSRAWYDGAADKIYSCGSGQGFTFSTDESCIYAVFVQLKNDLDISLLIKAFGNRRKSFSLTDANLSGWISSELDPEEIAALNGILSRKSIKYRF